MANPDQNLDNLRLLMGRAVQHHRRGEVAEAEQLYRQVLKTDPGHADAHNLMGLLAHQSDRQELAESHMQRSLELAPQRAEFHYNYANLLVNLGRLDQAAQEFQSAVDVAPDMNDAWLGLGSVLQSLHFELNAVTCFQRVLAADPRRPEVWRALGECLQSANLYPEAKSALREAQKLAPSDPELQSDLAALAIDSGDTVAASEALETLIRMAPDLPKAHYQLGVWLANQGRFGLARESLERALELAPDYYQAALYYAYIAPLSLDAPLVTRLSKAAERGGWSEPGQGANVHFALGYVKDKSGQYDAAFQDYLEANRLQRSLQSYTTESQLLFQRAALHAFGPDFQARAKDFADPSSEPLFIVGMPRSGTSLLEQILSSHPQVHGGGEMTLLHAELLRRLGPVGQVDFTGCVSAMPDASLAAVARSVSAQIHGLAAGKQRVTDKMPSNLTILGLVHALFPKARIIYCRRDPLDTCVSCFTTSFKSGHKFTNDLKELGEYCRIGESAMQRWQQMLPAGSIYELRYEDLVADMPGEIRKLLEFCGLDWDDACLRFQDNTRAVSTASVYQVRQPIYNSAVGRWHRYAEHLKPLQEALAAPPLL